MPSRPLAWAWPRRRGFGEARLLIMIRRHLKRHKSTETRGKPDKTTSCKTIPIPIFSLPLQAGSFLGKPVFISKQPGHAAWHTQRDARKTLAHAPEKQI